MSYTLRPTQIGNSESSHEKFLYAYGELRTIDSLRDPFTDTDHADKLRSLDPRFTNNYPWDDHAKFLELYGMDVDPYEHGPYQARTVAVPLVEEQPDLSGSERGLLVAYTVIHDDHEGTHNINLGRTVDIAKTEQTYDNELAEFALWEEIQKEVYGDFKTKHDRARIKDFAGPDALPSNMKVYWDTIEQIGYFLTAIRSWNMFNNVEDLTKKERDTCQKLAIEVMGIHLYRNEAKNIDGLEHNRTKVIFADDVLLGLSGQIAEIKRARGDK